VIIADHKAVTGRCLVSWKEIVSSLRTAGLRVNASGAPLDPKNVPYRLVKDGCDVDLDEHSEVPHR
jgi:hypothetical protein